jgi:hypothetical protein
VLGWTADVQSPAAALEAPRCKDWFDQLSTDIGQITRIWATLRHSLDVPP